MAGLIEDYAMIGDCRTAALIGRNGSIDWFCCPRFDSSACFAGLLGTADNGRWIISARGRKAKVSRRYRGPTMILETEFKTETGSARLIDFMPMNGDYPSIVRIVEGMRGKVAMQMELVLRFDTGFTIPWVNKLNDMTHTATAVPMMLALHTPVAVNGKDMRSYAHFTVHQGERVPFILAYGPSHLAVPQPFETEEALAATEKFWREWAAAAQVRGKWADIIVRSLLTLKALTYRQTGGIVAAVTTSLPELIGGTRNWDYRYCWLRDATLTLLAFLNAGYRDEARHWQNWLLRAVAGSPQQMQTLYGVAGERQLDEWELPWLSGYENSRPVRIGNAAAKQLQLDVYGELADVLAQAGKGGLPPPPRRTEIRNIFLAHLEKIWKLPDEGIWEIRGTPRHFVYSKAMAWVAFDRASKSEADARRRKHWRRIANKVHADVCRNGVDRERGCFVQSYGSKDLDASLLQLAPVGFLPPTDRRIRKTVAEIEKHLTYKGLVLRYPSKSGVDGLPPGEGAFLACSFWLADNYLLLGRLKDAIRLFRRLVRLCNDVGLLSEEYDPAGRRMLGNFPQAFSHVALVNTALNILHHAAPRRPQPVVRREKKRKS